MAKKKKTKKSKKVSKRKISKKPVSKKTDKNVLIYAAVAVLALIVIVFAIPGGKNKSEANKQTEVKKQTEVSKKENAQEIKENKVSDIKVTKEVKPLNIPKKKKAINQPSFNEKAVQIRFAEIDYNSNKKISLNEYLYYFKDKAQGKKQFNRVDKNGNKSISYEEYLAFKKR